MFELKRSGIINTEIKMGDDVIPVKININSVSKQFIAAQKRLMALVGTKVQTPEKLKQIESAWMEIMRMLFGDYADKILAFYDGNVSELARDVNPFLHEEIIPRIVEYGKEEKKKAKRARRGW